MLEKGYFFVLEWVFTTVVAAKMVLPEGVGFIGAMSLIALIYWATFRSL